MIDASHIKVYPHAAGANSGNKDMGRTKGDLLHLVEDTHGMPVRMFIPGRHVAEHSPDS